MRIANIVSWTLALAISLIGCSEPEPQEIPREAQNGTVTGTTGNHGTAAIPSGVEVGSRRDPGASPRSMATGNVNEKRRVNYSPEDYIEWSIQLPAEKVSQTLQSIVRGRKDWEIAALPSGGGTLFQYVGSEVNNYFGCITLSFGENRKHCTLYASPLYPEVCKVLREVHANLNLKAPITFK